MTDTDTNAMRTVMETVPRKREGCVLLRPQNRPKDHTRCTEHRFIFAFKKPAIPV
jgi:hypothetical protein